MVLEGFNSPAWYWVLASTVVSLVLVLGAVVVHFVLRVVEYLSRRR